MLSKEQLELISKEPKAFFEENRYIKSQALDKFKTVETLDHIEECAEERTRLLQEAHELLTLASDIESLILEANIKPNYKEVLRLRFIENLQIDEICARIDYAYRWVQRLLAQALKALAESVRGSDYK